MMLEKMEQLFPILTFLPIFKNSLPILIDPGIPTGSEAEAKRTLPSPIYEKFPIRTAFTSPRTTTLYQMRTFVPISTSPTESEVQAYQV